MTANNQCSHCSSILKFSSAVKQVRSSWAKPNPEQFYIVARRAGPRSLLQLIWDENACSVPALASKNPRHSGFLTNAIRCLSTMIFLFFGTWLPDLFHSWRRAASSSSLLEEVQVHNQAYSLFQPKMLCQLVLFSSYKLGLTSQDWLMHATLTRNISCSNPSKIGQESWPVYRRSLWLISMSSPKPTSGDKSAISSMPFPPVKQRPIYKHIARCDSWIQKRLGKKEHQGFFFREALKRDLLLHCLISSPRKL